MSYKYHFMSPGGKKAPFEQSGINFWVNMHGMYVKKYVQRREYNRNVKLICSLVWQSYWNFALLLFLFSEIPCICWQKVRQGLIHIRKLAVIGQHITAAHPAKRLPFHLDNHQCTINWTENVTTLITYKKLIWPQDGTMRWCYMDIHSTRWSLLGIVSQLCQVNKPSSFSYYFLLTYDSWTWMYSWVEINF